MFDEPDAPVFDSAYTASENGDGSVDYINSESDPRISKVTIRENNRHYHIRAYFPDQLKSILVNSLLKHHRIFEQEPSSIYSSESISIETADPRLLATAIRELVRVSPGMEEHLNSIQTRFNIDMNRAVAEITSLPKWDHMVTYNEYREATTDEFRNIFAHSKILKISVLNEREENRRNIMVEFSAHEHSEAFRSVLIHNRIIEASNHNASSNDIIFHINLNDPQSIQSSKDFIAQIRNFDPSIDEEMAKKLIKEPVTTYTRSTYLPRRSTTDSSTIQGDNTNELKNDSNKNSHTLNF